MFVGFGINGDLGPNAFTYLLEVEVDFSGIGLRPFACRVISSFWFISLIVAQRRNKCPGLAFTLYKYLFRIGHWPSICPTKF